MLCILITQLLTTQQLYANTKHSSTNFDINEYRGKVVYLDFWASWCKPCRKSFPWMNQLQNEYSKDKFVVVAVNLDKDKSLAKSFLKDNPADFKIIYDSAGNLAKKFKVQSMPTSIVFDQNGKIIHQHRGFFETKTPHYKANIIDALNKL